jgi:hypothetical protein
MPRYRYIDVFERALHGLQHDVNAVLHRKDGHEQPAGSTVVVREGDEVETDEPYPHALLVNVATGEPDVAQPEPVGGAASPPAAKRKGRGPRKAPPEKAAALSAPPAGNPPADPPADPATDSSE